jgi:RNA polymerase sigma-70 factor (ECF subfamily)
MEVSPEWSTEQLRAWHRLGRSAYPDVRVDEATFIAHLSRSARTPAGGKSAAIELFVEDLFLACACANGDARGIQIFRKCYGKTVRAALAGLSPTPDDSDDLEQQVYEQLLLGGTTGTPQIERYGGQAPLAHWLTVVVRRVALMNLRAEGAQARARDAAARERIAQSIEAHAEVAYLKEEYRPLVKQALIQALAELPARDRVVLHLHVVGGAGVARIGKIYGVSISTVSRWLAKARVEILKKTQQLVSVSLRLTPAESESLMALVASQLDVSVGELFLPEA